MCGVKGYGCDGVLFGESIGCCGFLLLKLVRFLFVSFGVELLKLIFSICRVRESSWLDVNECDRYLCQASFVIGRVFGKAVDLT